MKNIGTIPGVPGIFLLFCTSRGTAQDLDMVGGARDRIGKISRTWSDFAKMSPTQGWFIGSNFVDTGSNPKLFSTRLGSIRRLDVLYRG